MAKHPDLPVIEYRHKVTDEVQTVYEGTGAHDALRTDPDYERVEGVDPADVVASKTEKIGLNDDLGDLSTPELRQLAAQAGHPDPFSLKRDDALEIAEKRAERLGAGGITSMAGDERQQQAVRDGAGDGGSEDGTTPESEPEPVDPVDDERTKRDVLEGIAREAGITDPDDREKFPNKGTLVEAIRSKRRGE